MMKWKGAAQARRLWSAQQEEQLRAMAAEGQTLAEIALKLGKTVSNVRGRAVHLKIKINISEGDGP